jgi:SAM-dependent methyltransferase
MNPTFSDHFAPVAASYADFRPTYPQALFAWLASVVARHELAWDCAAGSGQASVDLATHFTQVVATDASPAQIGAALPHPRIEYRVAPAESSGLADASVDLITVAQALHWFDLPGFYDEVRRVLRPTGALAVWTYGVLTVEGAAVDELVQRFYHDTVGPYWPAERRHVEDGYRSLPFPFAEIAPPPFSMAASWTLAELLGYFRSWSATGRFIAANGRDPVAALERQLTPLWGAPDRRRLVTWPLSLRVGRNTSRS